MIIYFDSANTMKGYIFTEETLDKLILACMSSPNLIGVTLEGKVPHDYAFVLIIVVSCFYLDIYLPSESALVKLLNIPSCQKLVTFHLKLHGCYSTFIISKCPLPNPFFS